MSKHQQHHTLDLTLGRIESFNEAKGGGVTVRKDPHGYSLFVTVTGAPVARLRPLKNGDLYDILWWSHRDRWEPVGEFGGTRLPLDEALEFVAEDPMGCFWS